MLDFKPPAAIAAGGFCLGTGCKEPPLNLPAKGEDGHQHLVCTPCAEVVEMNDCFTAEVGQCISVANVFLAVTFELEFFGICPECRQTLRLKRKSRACARLVQLNWIDFFTRLLPPASPSIAGIL